MSTKLTEETLLECGFTKEFGWGNNLYRYKDRQLILINQGVSGANIYKIPETVNELIATLEVYLRKKYTNEGISSAQRDMRYALGFEE